jgi:hypothetical protein
MYAILLKFKVEAPKIIQFQGRNKHQERSRYEEITTNKEKRQCHEGKGSGGEGFAYM